MQSRENMTREFLDIVRNHNFEVGTFLLQEIINSLAEEIREADNSYAADCSYEEKCAAESALWEFTHDGGVSWLRNYAA